MGAFMSVTVRAMNRPKATLEIDGTIISLSRGGLISKKHGWWQYNSLPLKFLKNKMDVLNLGDLDQDEYYVVKMNRPEGGKYCVYKTKMGQEPQKLRKYRITPGGSYNGSSPVFKFTLRAIVKDLLDLIDESRPTPRAQETRVSDARPDPSNDRRRSETSRGPTSGSLRKRPDLRRFRKEDG